MVEPDGIEPTTSAVRLLSGTHFPLLTRPGYLLLFPCRAKANTLTYHCSGHTLIYGHLLTWC